MTVVARPRAATCCTGACSGPRWSRWPWPRTTRPPPRRRLAWPPRTTTRILGVPRDADDAELKKAYRNLARDLPPRPQPRRQDRPRSASRRSARPTPSCPTPTSAPSTTASAPWPEPGGAGGDVGFGTIFEDLFEGFFGGGGGGRCRSRARRGDDLRYDLEISLEEAAAGPRDQAPDPAARDLRDLPRAPARSRAASPRPAAPAAARARCASPRASSRWRAPAPTAAARGASSSTRARAAAARGACRRERLLKVTIPAGVEDGNQLRLNGEGEGGLQGGPAGRSLRGPPRPPHEIFVRDGAAPDLRAAAHLPPGGARRRGRGAGPRRHRRS